MIIPFNSLGMGLGMVMWHNSNQWGLWKSGRLLGHYIHSKNVLGKNGYGLSPAFAFEILLCEEVTISPAGDQEETIMKANLPMLQQLKPNRIRSSIDQPRYRLPLDFLLWEKTHFSFRLSQFYLGFLLLSTKRSLVNLLTQVDKCLSSILFIAFLKIRLTTTIIMCHTWPFQELKTPETYIYGTVLSRGMRRGIGLPF